MLSGVYKIENKMNNKCYIGSSNNIKRRFREHKKALLKNKHHSRYLQNAWNKYGEKSFCFEIIEKCSIETVLEREQYYINEKKPEYNICLVAGTTAGVCLSETTKEKLREKAKKQLNNAFKKKGKEAVNYGRKHTKEWKEKISNQMKGEKNHFFGKKHSQETKNRISKCNSGLFVGQKNKNAKITEKDIIEIRRLYKLKQYTQKEIGNMFNIDQTNVSLIVRNKSWTHIVIGE